MAPSKRNSRTARRLRADIPRVPADDWFIATLADLAASSTPATDRSRVGKTALRVKIAAVTASVALVSLGAAYAVDQLGGDERTPVGPTHTVDPASPSEPAEEREERDEDLAPHDLDEGQEHQPLGDTRTGEQDETGSPSVGAEGSSVHAPVPQGPTGGHDADPKGAEPESNSSPDDASEPASDPAPGHTPRPTTEPEADPDADPADTDAEPSNAEGADTKGGPNADGGSGKKVNDK